MTLSPALSVDPDSQSGSFSVSSSGAIAWRAGEGVRRELTWYNRRGEKLDAFKSDDPLLLNPELSPTASVWRLESGRPRDVYDASAALAHGRDTSRCTAARSCDGVKGLARS